MKFKNWLHDHASGLALIATGGVLYITGNHAEGAALLSAGLASFGIKISTPKG
jgi:hypothetical protein